MACATLPSASMRHVDQGAPKYVWLYMAGLEGVGTLSGWGRPPDAAGALRSPSRESPYSAPMPARAVEARLLPSHQDGARCASRAFHSRRLSSSPWQSPPAAAV